MKSGVLDGILEIETVAEKLGNLARQDQGSSLSLLVKEPFPLVCPAGFHVEMSMYEHTSKDSQFDTALTLRSPFILDLIHGRGQLGKHVIGQAVVGCAVETDLPTQVGRAGDFEKGHRGQCL